MTPWTVAHQAPLAVEFSRQEHWSGLPCPPSGGLSDPGIKPWSPALQADSLPSELQGKPITFVRGRYSHHHPHIFDLDMSVIFLLLHLILLHFSVLHSMDTVFFYKLKVCGSLVLSKPTISTFPTAFAHFVSVSHLGNSCSISDFY